MYYVLETRPHQLVGMILYPEPGWGLEFTKGKVFDACIAAEKITVKFESEHEVLPDYFELDGTPIVSDDFVKVWKDLHLDNYQLLPVSLEFPKNSLNGYSILNIVNIVDCIDRENSDLSLYKRKIMRISNLILDQTRAEGELFRLKGYPLTIVVSEETKSVLEGSNLNGMLLTPAQGWGDEHRY